MHIQKLKVRPKKNAAVSLCAPELATMLGCWAAKNNMTTTGACAESAKALYDCMRTTPMGGKQHRPTINYHLARLNKVLK
ncbi:hypothetical protein BDM02DRAFT_3087845 [Thelephora ganbajun]|uniref:Uncharacterized protein n=1 Tax=Thelephora ganbajun TaxID=370292 RepID=A0ACB6ZU99_THEGA|nr:hypothetical protein BDM02DRAFT_3087845 [Thelephora ganbajun]